MLSFRGVVQLIAVWMLLAISALAQAEKWSEQKARDWYARQPWLVGSNYNPASAINQLEMWQADSFDPKRIDLELGWAEGLGMNTMRVYLHDLLWQQDPEGFKRRLNEFLTIAAGTESNRCSFSSTPLGSGPEAWQAARARRAYTIPAGCKARAARRCKTSRSIRV